MRGGTRRMALAAALCGAALGCAAAPAPTTPGSPAPAQQASPAPSLQALPAPTPAPAPQAGRAPTPAPEAQPAPGAGGFPSPEQLRQLGEAPASDELFRLDVVPLAQWRLAGPFPDRFGAIPRSGDDPWSGLLAEEVRARAGLAVSTHGMHCVARELGRFYLAHGGQPTDGLRRFMTSRCNAAVSQVGFGYVDSSAVPEVTEQELFARWQGAVAETIRKSLAGGPRSVGIWFGRTEDRAVAMVAYGAREVHVEPFSPFANSDGRLEIRGEALTPALKIAALVNRGRFGVAECEGDPMLRPPRFRFVCQVEADDPSTHVALSLTPPDRLLARNGITVLAWPSAQTVDVYRQPHYGVKQRVTELERVPGEFVDLLNQVRREAGLGPVALDPVQTEAAKELAPHFFAALFNRSPNVYADLVVLGMIAGWSVEGIVQSGHFASAWAMRTNDLGRLLASALEYPVSREALLAAEIDRIAVGPVLDTTAGRESVAAVFGTYSLFSARSHDSFAQQVYEKLDADRARRGVGSAERLDQLSPLCQQAASAVEGGLEPADAMNGLLQGSVRVLRRAVSGWIAEVTDLDDLEFPLEYLDDPSFAVAVAVSHRKPQGEPWGRYVVMLLVADPEVWGT